MAPTATRLGALAFGLALGCAALPIAAESPADQRVAVAGEEPITPIPLHRELDQDKLRLGERLFRDPRLSRDGSLACASCHDLEASGDDGVALSAGLDGRPLDFNSPSVFNATLSFRLNWRGNFRRLEEQAAAVLLDPRLMGNSWPALMARLRRDPGYKQAFAAAYGAGPTPARLLDALATFQRSLITPNARFDRYLRGERDAITPDEERGYQLFKTYGCVACHQGVNVGGNLFQRFGIFHDPFAERATLTTADLGRFAITGKDSDRHVFRVPSLRNVAVTAPYLHDGSAPSLEKAVAIMARNQLGMTISNEEIALIIKFLRTLTGEYRGRSLAAAPEGASP